MRIAVLLCLLAVPALAQPSVLGGGSAPQQAVPASPTAVPLPPWFVDIDTGKKGEVSRADFLKYRMRVFDEFDANKDGKLSIEEFIKTAEPPFSRDVPGGPTLEERRSRARADFRNTDTNGSGFIDRPEAEALVNAEFNQYDVDRDNNVSEAEIRMIVQSLLQRQAAERQQIDAERRRGLAAINDLIDVQLRDADQIDKNRDGRISQQEFLVQAGPPDGPESKGMLPYDIRKQLILRKFQEIDTNKDNALDRVELTAYAVRNFLATDLNKDRYLSEDELKKGQEAEAARMREIVKTLTPPAPRPAAPPAPPRGGQPPAPAAPVPAPAAPPGLPQGVR